MSDTPTHNKHIKGPLPAPDVPVNDAWQQMHQLLVQHHLTEKPGKDKRRWLLWLCLFLLISTGGIITYLSFNNNHHQGSLYKHKTVAGKQNIHLKDSNRTSLNKI